ncbi:unnamed protein product [Anisakis simplex]|uniref:enoyl-CoA hydratase n=1 Tax=Anisakis simplex TaxID=6269 RepID=A0A0M3KG86_ANISI|nr:unnamed protein product [Anisakis simplex]
MEQFAPLSMVIRCGVAVVKIDGPGKYYITYAITCICYMYFTLLMIEFPLKENVLNGAVIEAFGKLMEDVQNRGDINAILVMSAKHNSFIAGADVEMLKNAKSVQEATEMSQNGQRKFQQLEDSQIPIVAAIMGSCMGGGLELALACHYRIAVRSDRTAFSFPEVRLGLLPGAGGTQRLPRIVALPTALDMMLSGRSIDAQKAKQFGIVDVLLDPVLNEDGEVDGAKSLCYLEQIGVQAALRLATKTLKVDRCASLWQTAYQWIMSSSIVWNRFIKPSTISMIYSKGGNHYPATYAILKCIEDGVFRGPSIGYATEAEVNDAI